VSTNIQSLLKIPFKKKLPLNREKPLAEPDSGRVAIHLDQLGFERTEKRGQQTP